MSDPRSLPRAMSGSVTLQRLGSGVGSVAPVVAEYSMDGILEPRDYATSRAVLI